MKQRTVASIVVTGVGIAAFAFTPLNAYARRLVTYVTLQPSSQGTPDTGHINVKGEIISGSGFQGDGTYVTHVKAESLALPMSVALVGPGNALSVTSDTGMCLYAISNNYGAIFGGGPNFGVIGSSNSSGMGVFGYSVSGNGGYFMSGGASAGMFASSATGNAVVGQANVSAAYGVFSYGNTGATGTKSFLIDDPRDPANRTLRHYSEEGPEPLNVYTGSIRTDARGYATVVLPDYFDTINKSPRYQLTVVDDTDSPDFVLVKVVRREADNRFSIRSSKPGIEVSWRVEAIRNDPWMQKNGAPVSEEKPAAEKGRYLQPELYGQPIEAGTNYNPTVDKALRVAAK